MYGWFTSCAPWGAGAPAYTGQDHRQSGHEPHRRQQFSPTGAVAGHYISSRLPRAVTACPGVVIVAARKRQRHLFSGPRRLASSRTAVVVVRANNCVSAAVGVSEPPPGWPHMRSAR